MEREDNLVKQDTPKEVTYIVKQEDAVEENTGLMQEELADAPKSLLFSLLKTAKIGIDLSRITLPTFLLEPKSMLEKFGDFMSHGDLISLVPSLDSPEERMIQLVKWFLSGFYLRPKGVKKPYNPILGELHRSMWDHGNSKSFLVSEQVSHHPPISAFYCSNRKQGFVANGAILFRSKFLGNSAASILEGSMSVFILRFNEEYEITFPDAYCRGIILGTLLMEYCGTVKINCEATGFKSEIEFKAKPFFGGDYYCVEGKIIKDGKPLYIISGKWDTLIEITEVKSKESKVLWNVTGQRSKRLPRYTVKIDEQLPNESERLWIKVTNALIEDNQTVATDEKTILENSQREAARQRQLNNTTHAPRCFVPSESTGKKWKQSWVYKHINTQPHDPKEEGDEQEIDFIIANTKPRQ